MDRRLFRLSYGQHFPLDSFVREVPARVRVVLAVLWLACLVGPPIITRLVRLPLVPLAVLLLGWAVLDTWRAAQTRARPWII